MKGRDPFAEPIALKLLPFSLFSEILKVSPTELKDLQAFRLENLMRNDWQPKVGSPCWTSSGRFYLYGPVFIERINAWQNFIMSTREKKFGRVFHYSHLDDPEAAAWTDYADRHRVRMPLDPISARRLIKIINNEPASRALIFSGSLLADLLIWADQNDVQVSRDVIFTTFEVFPKAMEKRLLRSFPDWCDYMRSWDGGMTYWRCKEGRYHTLDNATIMHVDEEGRAVVTDLSNQAQAFVNYRTDDLVERSNEYTACPCGAPYCGFKHVGHIGWRFFKQDGSQEMVVKDMHEIPPGVQIYQSEPGKINLLQFDPWTTEDMQRPDVVKIIERGWEPQFQQGYFRRKDKKPPVFSALSSLRRRVSFGGGYHPKVDVDFVSL